MGIEPEIDFEGALVPENAQAIRTWLNDHANTGKIAHITRLDLNNMDLELLPSEISKFTQLTWLNLSDNQLTELPEAICELTQLTSLGFSYNRIMKLPEAIGNLTQLRALDVTNNRLTSLPKSISNLTRLCEFFPSGNLLISFLCKPDPLSIVKWHNTYHYGPASSYRDKRINHEEMVKEYSACSDHVCNSALASLCQEIHRGSEDDVLKDVFAKLTPEMQSNIRKQWATIASSSKAEEDLFADRTSFTKAVIAAVQEKWNASFYIGPDIGICSDEGEYRMNLYKQQLNQALVFHNQTLTSAGKSGDARFGQVDLNLPRPMKRFKIEHPIGNIICMIDAMEYITQE